jgi:ABC-type multidrug transport system permease subunit
VAISANLSPITPMTILLSQLGATMTYAARLILRRPRHLIVSTLLSCTFLLLLNQLFIVRLGPELRIGIAMPSDSARARVAQALLDKGVSVVHYYSEPVARDDVAACRIAALVVQDALSNSMYAVVLNGRNPLLDRELLLMLVERGFALQNTVDTTVHVQLDNSPGDPARMTRFMTASVLPFLILALLAVNSGWWWVMEIERNTLNGFLATPVSRPVLVAGPVLAGALLSTGMLALAVLLTRRLVSWPWPARPAQFCALIGLTVFMAAGLTLAQATLCRSIMVFGDVTAFGLFVLFFASAVVTPLETMAAWQRWVAHFTPTYYAVRALRAAAGGGDIFRWRDVFVLCIWGLSGFLYGGMLLTRSTLERPE